MLRIAVFPLLLLAMLTGCSPPKDIADRPVTPPQVAAASLLPPGPAAPLAYPGARDAAGMRTPDGRLFLALRFATPGAAADAAAKERHARTPEQGTSTSTAVDVLSVHYFSYGSTSRSGFGWVSGTWLFIAEAPDAASLNVLMAASHAGGPDRLPFPAAPWMLALLFVLALAAVLGVVWAVIRFALRKTAVHPPPGTPVLTRNELTARLQSLNAPGRPWFVRSGPEADLIVEWKYADAAWWGLLAKSGVKKAYRLRLYFDDENRRCAALDEFGELEWSAGLAAAPSVRFSRSFFRGVQLVRVERGVAYGLKTPAGTPGKVLDYRFDIDDVKRPVIDTVVGAGWTYQPVLRPLPHRTPD
jgi:hypothetical protein